MKKRYLCFLLILLCLASCGKKTPPADPFVPVSYETEDIIERNETLVGTFTDTSRWAVDYCLNAHAEYDVVTCEYLSGFVSPDTFMAQGYSCGAATWSLALSSGESVSVQVIYAEHEGTLTLCGVFENGKIMTSRPAVYTFVASDPRFASLCTDFPDITEGLFDNVLRLNVTNVEAAGMLDENTVLAVEVVSYGYEQKPLTRLHFFSVSSKKELRREDISDLYYHDTVFSDGYASVLLRDKLDSPNASHEYRYGATGKGELAPLPDPTLYKLSDSVTVVSDDKGISVNGELKLPTRGKDADIDKPYFVCALDDHRFIYCNGAWEWTWGVSLYDTDTKESVELFGENYLPLGVYGEKLYLLSDEREPCGNLWSLDLATLEKKQALQERSDTEGTDVGLFDISRDGKLLSAIRSSEGGTRRETLETYSLSSGALLSQKPLDLRAGYSKKVTFLGGNPALLFHLFE
ncbi:MAG: hypothetical protein IJS65_01530, partial [Clostridia bacterium]|nr:hypothetical protein [Clostridia bacterium]